MAAPNSAARIKLSKPEQPCVALVFLFSSQAVKRRIKRIPALIACAILLVSILVSWLRPDFVERFERITFDMRVRHAFKGGPTVATNLGFAFIDEETIIRVQW